MPQMCFSYPADLPPGTGARDVVPPAPRKMPFGSCFSYTAEVPRSMPIGTCFSYSVDAPQPAPPGLHRMTNSTCFRY